VSRGRWDEAGSSLDKVASARNCQTGPGAVSETKGIREKPVLLRLLTRCQLQSGGLAGSRCTPAWEDRQETRGRGLVCPGQEATVKDYGVAVAMPQG
jgi:hypothetical protein